MESEGALPHSQVPVTCSYLEPARSSPWSTFHVLKSHLNIILPSTGVFQVVSFPRVSPPKPCIRLFYPPYALHFPPISFFSNKNIFVINVSLLGHRVLVADLVSLLIQQQAEMVRCNEKKTERRNKMTRRWRGGGADEVETRQPV